MKTIHAGDPAALRQRMWIDVVHPHAVPAGAGRPQNDAPLLFAVLLRRELGDLEGADLRSVVRMAVLREPGDGAALHQHPAGRPRPLAIVPHDRAAGMPGPRPAELGGEIELQRVVLVRPRAE